MNILLSNNRFPNFGLAALLIVTIVTILVSPSFFVKPASAQTAPRVALVTRTIPIPASDIPYRDHLRSRGWSVSLIDDDRIRDSGESAIRGFDLVVISQSVYGSRIDARLRNASEPIIVSDHELYSQFGLTGSRSSDRGYTTASRRLDVVAPFHELAAGLNGDVIVSSKAKPMNFGKLGPDAIVIATAKDSASQPVIFAYDTGDEMAGGLTARGPRVGFYMSQAHPRLGNRDAWALFDAAANWAASNAPQGGGVAETPVAGEGTIAPENGALLGANISRENASSRYAEVLNFQRSIRRELDFVNRFHEFSSGLSSSFYWDRQHIEDGRTLMISWRATDNAGSTRGQPDPQRARKIVTGQFDRQIDAMATAMRDLEAPVLLRFNWEMDQDVGDNQYIGTPQEFIAAWRYVHRRFEQRGATNVEWVWSPRARSFAKNVGQTFYPGYDYVDWVGGSAVPINSFEDPVTIYSQWNQWAANIGKPQLLWIGLRENPNDSRWKAGFINQLRSVVSGEWSGVKALVYYSSNSPLGFDYTIDTTTASLNAFRNLACDSHFTPEHRC